MGGVPCKNAMGVNEVNPCHAEPGDTLPLQTV